MISILNFITSYTGWQVFAASVLELINPSRLPGQLKNLVTIIVALVENDCVHGAVDVAHRIYSTIAANNFTIQQLEQSDVDTYVDAIVALEAHPATAASGSVLDKFFLPFFDQLACYQKCRLFIDLQEANSSRLDCLPSCLDLYKKSTVRIIRRSSSIASGGRRTMTTASATALFGLKRLLEQPFHRRL